MRKHNWRQDLLDIADAYMVFEAIELLDVAVTKLYRLIRHRKYRK